MSIKDDLVKLKEIKKQIHQSIANKEVTIADDLPFEDYPSKIDKITGGGGSISGQEFTVNNDMGYDIKQGDMVWVDWAPYVQGENKLTDLGEYYHVYNIPSILDQSGNKAFSGVNGQTLILDGLDIKNKTAEFGQSLLYKQYVSQNTGHFIISDNACFYQYGGKAYRSDSIYVDITGHLSIPGDSTGSMYQSVFYVGENFFLRVANSPAEGYSDAQLFQVDMSSAKVLRQWKLVVPQSWHDRWGWNFAWMSTSWIFHEDDKTFLIDFYHGYNFELPMNSTEELPSVDPTSISAIGQIYPVGFTKDGQFMFARGRPEDYKYCLLIYKKGNSVNEWSLLDVNDLSANVRDYYNRTGLNFLYNTINQVVTVATDFEHAGSDGYATPGKAFRYIGVNESGKVIFEELPCDMTKFTPPYSHDTWAYVYYSFGPTYSQDCGKYIISKHVSGAASSDGQTHNETIVGYAKTGIFLNCVKDPSNFGAFAIQGIAKQDIPNGTSGKITTLAMEQIDINLTSKFDLDFEVQTGV